MRSPLRGRMARLSAVLLLALGLIACGGQDEGASRIPPPPSQIVYNASAYDDVADATMKHYLQVADALAHDRFEEALSAATKLAGATAGDLQPLAQAAASTQDITGLRIAFKPLSNAVQALNLPEGMAVAYCPMAFDYDGGHWVQRDGPIMNPYFGAAMLHCGVFEDEEDTPGT
ncbi:MAG: DUF3347 domain-containing protein [Gemmatimonadetes bacterium]|jgi:hypothetical protein|nr:DUF3347 domain-containing protein [Gemmatimonadota bacterium]MBT6144946.1 DUF3347 domain-containing protein [Gemmatimonadota bacterium]MBT7860665.1 DUF3347 domain-containing protein [Gemmatimonadota bacterium]